MKLAIGAATDAGRVREGNEDAFLVDERMGLVAVADGMGGHRAGEVASATALEALRANVAHGVPIREAIVNANAAVLEKAESDESLRGMGTTVTAGTVASGDTLLVGHVGDSRLYLLRDSDLRQVTSDHSLVEELVREGQITAEQAATHPRRSIITRSVGVDEEIDVDVYPLELQLGDRLVFCSDGLTDMLRDEDIVAVLRRESDPQRGAAELVAEANRAGGEDNITAVVVDAVTGESPVEHPAAIPADVGRTAELVAEGTEAPPAADDATGPDRVEEPARDRRARRVVRAVARVVLWALPILLVLGIAFGAVAWYARGTYFVTLDGSDRVVLFKGRSGGVFLWDPTVELRTDLEASDLTAAERDDLEGELPFSSRSEADEYLERLERGVEERAAASATTTTTTAPEAP